MLGESVPLTRGVHLSEDGYGMRHLAVRRREKSTMDESQRVSTLDRDTNFLLARESAFGRAVWFNSRLMF